MTPLPLLDVTDLAVHFPVRRGLMRREVGRVRAVDGVSFTMAASDTLALVGESGCGKSTTGNAILGLTPPTGGTIRFDGRPLTGPEGAEARAALRKDIQVIFQDPVSSFDPRMTVEESVAEPMIALGHGTPAGQRARVAELFDLVGLDPNWVRRFPHQFSGGQRQRLAIARALALEPRLVVCDEPVSALDVSIRAQILNLLAELQRRTGVAYLFISHDLSVVRHVADRVAVMYLGRIVETGPADAVFADPRHPYTRALIGAIPVPDPVVQRRRSITVLGGEPPSPMAPPSGCAFRTRCPRADDRCAAERPTLIGDGTGHAVACWHAGMSEPATDNGGDDAQTDGARRMAG